MRNHIITATVTAIVAVATVATAQIYSGPTISIKPVATGAAITAVTPDAFCGSPIKVGVTIKAGAVPAEGTIVVGGTARFTSPYKVAPNTSATIWVPTTAQVTCNATGSTVPGGSVWLEPTTGGSDAMMWTFKPQKVTYGATKQSIPG
jgi:hypothetical protein